MMMKAMALAMFRDKPDLEAFLAATFWSNTMDDEQSRTAVCKAFNAKGRASDI